MRNADRKFAEKLVRTREPIAKSELLSLISTFVVKNPKSKIEAEPYLKGTSQESTPEDARLPARLRPIGDYAPEGRAYSSERRTAISRVAASNL